MKWTSILVCTFQLSAASLPVVLSRTGNVHSEAVTLKALDPGHQYSLLYAIYLTHPWLVGLFWVKRGEGNGFLLKKFL